MVKVHDTHIIQGFEPEDVFEAGIRTKNIPKQLEHLAITPPKNQRKLRLDSTLAVVFGCDDGPLSHFHNGDIKIETQVTEFEPGELVVIEGESDEVAATLRIELAKIARRSTQVSHELEIELRKNRVTRMLFEAIGPVIFQKDIVMFRTAHLENTVKDLEKEPATVTPIRGLQIDQPVLKRAASGI